MKKKKIKFVIKEIESYHPDTSFSHMGDDERYGDEPLINDPRFENVVPQPRTRVPKIEDYTKSYSFLMGHGNRSTGVSIEDIMKETQSQDPASVAQALADYLIDRARIY
tara:strand:- start:259 stop:585 length:327 start_codon:yes stop_codon:yes gene_type:complete